MSSVVASRSESLRWFLREPSQHSAARLFCLPYSGCGASMYRSWPRFIDQIEVCPIQLPGRERRIREPTYITYEALAESLTEAVLPYLDRPFAFFGHCGSALACYATAVHLWQRKAPLPVRLFISSQVAPHQGPFGRFLQMTDTELAEELTKLIRRMGGEPEDDLVAMCLGVLRADVEANKRYRPARPVRLPCAITAIGWEDDCEVKAGLMAGWSECGETTFRILKGGHYRFLEAPEQLLTVMAEHMQLSASP